MWRKLKKVIKHLIGRPIDDRQITMKEWLMQCGAVIGEDVELIECSCNAKDAIFLEIGNHVTCVYTHFLPHDASLKRSIGNDCNKVGRIVIGDNVFIGLKSIVLPNVKIGSNVIIGAGSVVTKNIPENSVAVGNPAHVICSYQDYVSKHKKTICEHPELVYWGINSDEMSKEEKYLLNEKIDGKIIYVMKKN